MELVEGLYDIVLSLLARTVLASPLEGKTEGI
jgi:hypothetical protein